MHKYLPHTEGDIKQMLDAIGVGSLDELFEKIPKKLQYQGKYDVPNQLSDLEVTKLLNEIAANNKTLTIFRGYGAYDVYTPSIIKALTSRQEFITSYTPYQPEVSQGTLQYIFEYQSMICEITGMDVTNASMYDGPTATAEAILMAISHTGKKKIVYSSLIHPRTIEVVKTYGHYRDLDFVPLPEKDGLTDFSKLAELSKDSAAVLVQSPNVYGNIEHLNGISDTIHAEGSLFIMNTEITSLALFNTPGNLGADIACGDLQSLGVPLSFGGAYIGFLAAKTPLLRKMPGRICGITTDQDGKRAFVLTLQAREQHIRRAKANSNICSNQSLMALSVAIYLSSMGKEGFIDLARLSLDGAYYLEAELVKTGLFTKSNNQTHYKEFVLESKIDPKDFDTYLIEKGYLGPQYLGDGKYLFAVTEKRTKDEIDQFVKVVGEFK
ncbi:aminomethyl-transferring glycine dehydrogenase subunit GcvPA [Acholeplasma equirhinis]|uniref:aminomethyl-transferring glycine dehydrogenase subunit GcvPA n=1 Tax=Acholeplasma equirhinis TaxID=555393 RepID=UPI00197B0022|nr:aminomethyl-transferring glycine dehydrogenase subunit GcvPA [Acholeplasma equirhinis]MBN3490627.1 aminomethyl-transferring glycine dehydrogenase subunit GcvPA [Acholeplasma equirhinis]